VTEASREQGTEERWLERGTEVERTNFFARQVEEAGWLGLAGFLLFSLAWALLMPFGFAEAFNLAAVGDRGADVCGELPGNHLWGRAGEMNLGALPTLWTLAIRAPVYARRPAVWHRDAPRRHPAALGGRSACRRGRADPCGCATPGRAPADSGGTGGASSGLAGICALV
jgi:hypothetical protein